MENDYIPFCGVAPLPDDLWSRWLFDPVLGAGLMALAGLLIWKACDRRAAVAGWVLVALLFVSPLCAASMALFSARVGQHLLLTLVAAPLLARALPVRLVGVGPAVAGFGLLFWIWHAPAPYAATLQSDALYWAMHLSLLGAAWVLWSGLMRAVIARPHLAILGVAATAAQMTLLSALLVFSSEVWHAWHLFTTLPYGLTAQADQQLAGAIMWAAGGVLILCAVAMMVRRLFAPDGLRGYSSPSS